MTPLEVVIDCDPGVDDALALLALAAPAAPASGGALRVRCVTTVAGNAPVEVTGRNAAYVISRSALRGTPVFAGIDRTAAPGAAAERRRVHGADGLGGLAPANAAYSAPTGAIEVLAGALRQGTVILALGPLSNVARALEAADHRVGQGCNIVVMGGRGPDQPAGTGRRGEFNFAFDAPAADAVLSSGVPVTLVPIDVTERVAFCDDDLALLRDRARNSLVADLLAWSLGARRDAGNVRRSSVHDAVAAMILVSPDLMETSTQALSVCKSGPEAGRLLAGGDERSAVLAGVDCDTAEVKRRLLELWAGTPAPMLSPPP